MGQQGDFARAKKVAGAKIGFYIHLTAYVAVNALLVAINLATSTEHLWFKWPLLGWGVGVLVHAIVTFALTKGPVSQRRVTEWDTRKSAMKKPQP